MKLTKAREAEINRKVEQALLYSRSWVERIKKERALMDGKKESKVRIPSAKNEDQPVTRKLIFTIRDELKADIHKFERKMETRFSGIEARFGGIEARFGGIDAQFGGIDARFSGIEAILAEIRADLMRIQVMYEEQHSNNQLVLEGHQALWQRLDQIKEGRD